MIAIVSVHISNITLPVARVLDTLQIALYTLPAAISVMCTYLISHRIFVTSKNRKFRKIIDIIVQSSLIYTVTLICAASSDVTKPHVQRSVTTDTIFSFISSLLTPISVSSRMTRNTEN